MKTSFEYDIFISYSQKDRSAAERLHAALEARKARVWRDKRLEESPAADVIAQINQAHDRSARVLVLWSRASVASAWVLAEAEKARMAGKIVTLALEPLNALLPFIPAPFNILPTVDISAAILNLEPVLRALGAKETEGQAGVIAFAAANVDISKLPDTYAKKLYGRDCEMEELLEAWDGGMTRIFAFDAMGGAGKTALIYHFVQALQASGWRGARSVFAWSFYSQGSNEDRQAGADDFFKAAFAHFGGAGKTPPRDPHQKGVELAHLVQAQRALLILDGMEPLQYAAHGGPNSSTVVGGIKDASMKALLKALAGSNPGLCVVTTRIRLAELAGAEGVTFRELEEIPLMDAIALLRDLGAEPAMPPGKYKLPPASQFALLVPPYAPPAEYAPGDAVLPAMPALVAKDLIETVQELRGHALALTLAGRYIALHKKGDTRAARELPDLPRLASGKERAPYRVMRAIEIALANRIAGQDAEEEPAADPAGQQLALLFFLGLFDRPADLELLPVVFNEAAGGLPPAAADAEMAKTNPLPLKRRLHALDEELNSDATPEWRKQQIKQLKQPLLVTQRTVLEARRRVLVRQLFGGMHAIARNEAKIADALAQLAEQGLAPRAKTGSIDCHPMVRDYFGARLKELDGETFCAAHGRLYDHYRYKGLPAAFHDSAAYGVLALKAAIDRDCYPYARQQLLSGEIREEERKQLPPSIAFEPPERLKPAFELADGPQWPFAKAAFLPESNEGMMPLFAAIFHGCAAEREEEAFNEVYAPRIARGNEAFAAKKLGLYGQELAALASFFTAPFITPSPRLRASWRALLLANVGFRLRALGRLEDAAAPMRAAGRQYEALQDLASAAQCNGNLSELLVTIGQVGGKGGAVAVSAQAVALADRSGHAARRMDMRSGYADGLLQSGALAEAEALFREAEELQKEMQPGMARLYSVPGYRYCDLLLARGRVAEAGARAAQAMEVAKQTNWPLDIALFSLIQAHAALAAIPALAQASQECAGRSAEALAALRRANNEDQLPHGLLAHAEALWRSGNASGAGEHLREAEAIARRGPMPLFHADTSLLAARIQLSEGRIARAGAYRDQAAALIEKHGYGRGAVQLAVLDMEIACADKAEDSEGAIAAAIEAVRGEPYYDERTGMTIGGGWWGLMPRLEALLPDDSFELARLRIVRDNYTDEREGYLAAQEGQPAGEEGEGSGVSEEAIGKPEVQPGAIREAVYAVLAETLEIEPGPAADLPDAWVETPFAGWAAESQTGDATRREGLEGAADGVTKAGTAELAAQAAAPPPAKKRRWRFFAGK